MITIRWKLEEESVPHSIYYMNGQTDWPTARRQTDPPTGGFQYTPKLCLLGYNYLFMIFLNTYQALTSIIIHKSIDYSLNLSWKIVKTLPGLYWSPQFKKPPCLHLIFLPHLSFTATVSFTGLKDYVSKIKLHETHTRMSL